MDENTQVALLASRESRCRAILAGLKTAMKEAPHILWQNLTWKTIVSSLIMLFYINEVFSQEDIDSFFQFFDVLFHFYLSIYLFIFSSLFFNICMVLGALILTFCASHYCFPAFRLLCTKLYYNIHKLARGFWKAMTGMREFFLIGRDEDEEKPKKEAKRGSHLGAPRSLRLDKTPQDTPPPTPTEQGHSRSSSGATTPGVHGGEGQSSGGNGGSSRRGRGRKGRRR